MIDRVEERTRRVSSMLLSTKDLRREIGLDRLQVTMPVLFRFGPWEHTRSGRIRLAELR